jgi:hypothetical protein
LRVLDAMRPQLPPAAYLRSKPGCDLVNYRACQRLSGKSTILDDGSRNQGSPGGSVRRRDIV